MRRAHWLKSNARSESAHAAVFVDTETDQVPSGPREVRHVLRFGLACYTRTRKARCWTNPEWDRFTDAGAFWSRVAAYARARSRVCVFAHNWSFDAPVLDTFSHLPALGFLLGSAVIDSPPVILRFRSQKATILLLDTLNWWRVPLAALGESVGLPKLPMPDPAASPEEWERYCRRDVEIIHAAMRAWWDFLDRYDMGGFAPTLAGQALRAYRHRFMPTRVLIDDHEDALALARSAYHGGRVECFKLGKIPGPVEHFDVNSMYPFVMKAHAYPAVLRLTARRVALPELARWLESCAVVADAELETDEPRYAAVVGKRLCFPVGRFRAALTTPDLLYALAKRHLRSVAFAAVYEKAPLFERFVSEFYRLRQDARDAGRTLDVWLLKILMNSLYGKFGQHGGTWKEHGPAPLDDVRQWKELDYETGEVTTWRALGGLLQRRQDEPECYSSHPAIAAHVTAYARARLWDLILLAGRGEVFYTDTDSLFVSEKGGAALACEVSEILLGYLKHEARYPWLRLHGPKDYETPLHRVVKGVRGDAVWLGPDSVEQDHWSTLRGLLARGSLAAPTTTRVVKHLTREYGKGEVQPDGSVLPFTLPLRPGGLDDRLAATPLR